MSFYNLISGFVKKNRGVNKWRFFIQTLIFQKKPLNLSDLIEFILLLQSVQ